MLTQSSKEYWDKWPLEEVLKLDSKTFPEDEEWKSLNYLGFDRYIVSNLGRVYSYKSKLCLLADKNYKRDYGYCRVSLYKEKIAYKYFVHWLVLRSFCDCPTNIEETRHLNNNRQDNRLINLEWSTHIKNLEDREHVRGEEHPHSKLTEKDVLEIRRLREENRVLVEELAKMYAVTTRCIYHIINRDFWTHI